ncbi:MAG: prephenate dehydratase [Blautia sp.]
MLDLGKMRLDIDVIDSEIVRLFEERMKICENVAQFKIETGKPVFDKSREQEKLKALGSKTHSEFNRCGVEELFQQIMSISRKRQYQLLQENGIEEKSEFVLVSSLKHENVTVVYQGVEGAYSFAAMKTFFGNDISSFHVNTWKDAMEEIRKGNADYAVLPIENSTAGIVQDNYDLLTEYDHVIVGEQIIRCEHVLTALPEASLEDIRTVYSHPQALMQCRSFLDSHREWHQMEWNNTAAAAKKVADEGDKTQAAISSRYAAEHFGLKILSENIYSNANNSTRFIIVARDKIYAENARKISVSYELPHESGSLYNSLSHFIYNGLNMTKIESRPILERNWEYRFFVDFEGNLSQSAVKNALRGLKAEVRNLRVHGNY